MRLEQQQIISLPCSCLLYTSKLEHEIDAVSAEQAAIDFMKNEKKQLVFWSKERTGACENPMFNRSMKMKEMIFCGELSLLLPECGSTGERGESQECIVDEEASLDVYKRQA